MVESSLSEFFGKGKLFEGAVIINLRDRPDRMDRSAKELKKIGLLDDFVVRMEAYKHDYAMYGCSLSHLEAVKYARWKNWNSVIIFEDDIRICDAYFDHARSAFQDLSILDWGLFQFGAILPDPAQLSYVTDNLFKFSYAFAGHAFALHSRVYDSLINDYRCDPDRGNWCYQKHYHFDAYLNLQLAQEYDSYAAMRLLISQYPGPSDNWGEFRDYADVMDDIYEKLKSPVGNGDDQTDSGGIDYDGRSGDYMSESGKDKTISVDLYGACVNLELRGEGVDTVFTNLFGANCRERPDAIYSDFRVTGSPVRSIEFIHNSSRISSMRGLLDEIEILLAARVPVGLLIKCAALVLDSQTVLIVGLSREDRSALIARLLETTDCAFVSTEMVFIPDGDTMAHGLHHPLSFTENEVADGCLDPLDCDGFADVLRDNQDVFAAPKNYRQRRQGRPEKVDRILCAFRVSNTAPALKQIGETEAAFKIFPYLRNAGNLPNNGMKGIHWLVKSVSTMEFEFSDLDQVGTLIESLIESSFQAAGSQADYPHHGNAMLVKQGS